MYLTEFINKRNIEDTPLFSSYIVLTIIVTVALILAGGRNLLPYCSSVIIAKVLLLLWAIIKKVRS